MLYAGSAPSLLSPSASAFWSLPPPTDPQTSSNSSVHPSSFINFLTASSHPPSRSASLARPPTAPPCRFMVNSNLNVPPLRPFGTSREWINIQRTPDNNYQVRLFHHSKSHKKLSPKALPKEYNIWLHRAGTSLPLGNISGENVCARLMYKSLA
ncbi:hypothetical protein HOY80DRAFT_979743 [Tuber brumale]|nr:hypothetical protein HOY80DRAFT_979743 [Tuber brumale]